MKLKLNLNISTTENIKSEVFWHVFFLFSNAGSWKKSFSFFRKWKDNSQFLRFTALSLSRVFPNPCILLTRHAPLYQEEFTLGSEGGCYKGLFRVTENTEDASCVRVGDLYFCLRESALFRVKWESTQFCVVFQKDRKSADSWRRQILL